jgi:hypothetical protein
MSRRSDPKKLGLWRERFKRFSSCGIAVGQFCSRERVSVASFYHWRKKLGAKGRRRRRTDGHGVFQQVTVAPAAPGLVSAASAICIRLPCGTRIEVGTEDLDALRTVVAEVVQADRGREAGAASC